MWFFRSVSTVLQSTEPETLSNLRLFRSVSTMDNDPVLWFQNHLSHLIYAGAVLFIWNICLFQNKSRNFKLNHASSEPMLSIQSINSQCLLDNSYSNNILKVPLLWEQKFLRFKHQPQRALTSIFLHNTVDRGNMLNQWQGSMHLSLRSNVGQTHTK